MSHVYEPDDLLPLSGIQHFFFCKRQWALIHIERQWEDNLRTAEGQIIHKRADDPYLTESRGDVIISRAFPLVSHQIGLYGIADVIEYRRSEKGFTLPGYDGCWSLRPVEYKRGKPKIDERDEVQLCAQVMCLEEMFHQPINTADFYYNEIRRRVHIDITNELRNTVILLSAEMHHLFNKGITPTAEKGTHCKYCSLEDICIPKLTKKPLSTRKYINQHIIDACADD